MAITIQAPESNASITTSVAAATTDTTVLASNVNRTGASIYNDSTATMYLKYGSGASSTSFYDVLYQGDRHVVEFGYIGQINALWSSATGNARVTELT